MKVYARIKVLTALMVGLPFLEIILHRKGNYISLILFFLSFFIICLTLKSFLTDFLFFLRKFSLSLSLCLRLPLAGTYAAENFSTFLSSRERENLNSIYSVVTVFSSSIMHAKTVLLLTRNKCGGFPVVTAAQQGHWCALQRQLAVP